VYVVSTNSVVVVCETRVVFGSVISNWAQPAVYQRPPLTLGLVLSADPLRWMTGRFPPPIEVHAASLPLPEVYPPYELPRAPARLLARLRGRRPLRGRPGRPH
jgi:hypothetical protein